MRFLSEPQAKSFPEVSQSLWFERKWSSLYQAFQDGRIDEKRLRDLFARSLPKADVGKWLWIGIDASKIARPDAVTSADRSAPHVHNLPECKKPITLGWQFSTVVLPGTPSSWTYILDQQRVASDTTAIEVALTQLKRLMAHLPRNAVVVLDRGYDANWLCRLKNNRCFYRVAPPPTGKKGGPCKDGEKLQPKDSSTHGNPDEMWSGPDEKGRSVEITCWTVRYRAVSQCLQNAIAMGRNCDEPLRHCLPALEDPPTKTTIAANMT
jgi:DDE superfamily endonuclease